MGYNGTRTVYTIYLMQLSGSFSQSVLPIKIEYHM